MYIGETELERQTRLQANADAERAIDTLRQSQIGQLPEIEVKGNPTVFFILTAAVLTALLLPMGSKRRSLWIALLMFASPLSAQMPSGLSRWINMDEWCTNPKPFPSTFAQVEPKNALVVLQKAKQCGVSVVISYPRRIYTNNWSGGTGDYSAVKHRRASEAYAKALPPDTLKKYIRSKTLLGISVGDDYGCAPCWNGEKIPLTEGRDAANYAKSKMPLAPIGVRLEPLKMSAVLGWKIDWGWAQWKGSKGNLRRFGRPRNYYVENAAAATQLGLAGVFYGINTTHCGGGSTPACTPTQITQWGSDALNAPKNCGFVNWRYDSKVWRGAYKTAWESLFRQSQNKSFTRCRR